MKKLHLLIFAVFALIVAFESFAAPMWRATLTSTDGGQTNVVTLQPNQTYELKCFGATGAFKVYDGGVTVDRNKDQDYPVTARIRTGVAEAAQPTWVPPLRLTTPAGTPLIAAHAYDAGNPDCQIYQLVGGGTATGGALPLGPITPR